MVGSSEYTKPWIKPTWPQTSRCPFTTKSHVKGSNCVKWSRYTTLKINNQHQMKVSAPFVFSPVCKYSVLVYPTGLDFFHSKYFFKQIHPKCPHLSVRFLDTNRVTDFAKFPVWISKDGAPWVCYHAHSKQLSQISSSISKDEAPTSLLTVGLLFIFVHHVSISQLWKFTASLKLHRTSNKGHCRK